MQALSFELAFQDDNIQESISTLESKLSKARDVRKKKGLLWDLYELTNSSNSNQSVGYLMELKKLSLLEADKEGLIQVIDKLVKYYESRGDARSMIDLELEKVGYSKELKDTTSFVTSELRLADLYKAVNQQEEALKHYFLALEGEDHPALVDYRDHIYNELGCLFRDQRDFQQATEYFMWANREAKVTNDSVELARAINNLGTVYYHREIYPQAYNLFTNALEIREALNDSLEIAYFKTTYLTFCPVGLSPQQGIIFLPLLGMENQYG